MKILKRYHNSTGTTVQYLVSSGERTARLSAQEVVAMYNNNLIENATLMHNGDFRAKTGCHIDTEVLPDSLAVVNYNDSLLHVAGSETGLDYYGKQHIKICKLVRRCAAQGNLRLDTSTHKGNHGRNLHLFKLIQACGVNVRDFVAGYLSVLQPYSLTAYKDVGGYNDVWFCELGYRTTMLIKLHEVDKDSPIVISFHESNINSRNRFQITDFTEKPCAVFPDKVEQLAGGYVVNYTLQKGFLRYQMQSTTLQYSNGVALVDYRDIKNFLNNTLQNRLRQLSTSYLADTDSLLPVLDAAYNISPDRLSFLSYGFTTVNNLCMLIDLFSNTTSAAQRLMIADVATATLAETTPQKQSEIVLALKEKYLDSNKLVNALAEIPLNDME